MKCTNRCESDSKQSQRLKEDERQNKDIISTVGGVGGKKQKKHSFDLNTTPSSPLGMDIAVGHPIHRFFGPPQANVKAFYCLKGPLPRGGMWDGFGGCQPLPPVAPVINLRQSRRTPQSEQKKKKCSILRAARSLKTPCSGGATTDPTHN